MPVKSGRLSPDLPPFPEHTDTHQQAKVTPWLVGWAKTNGIRFNIKNNDINSYFKKNYILKRLFFWYK